MGKPLQMVSMLTDQDDPMVGDELLAVQYPPGYVHAANITFNSGDEESDKEMPDGVNAAALNAHQLIHRGLQQAKREMKVKWEEPIIQGPGWDEFCIPGNELDGQATWGEIPAHYPGLSNQRNHMDHPAEMPQAAPRYTEVPQHSTKHGAILDHYMWKDWPKNVKFLQPLSVNKGDLWYYFIP